MSDGLNTREVRARASGGFQRDLSAALAVCVAVMGAGFASGREIVVFFASLGWWSLAGVLLACAGIGYLSYAVALLSKTASADNLPSLYSHVMGKACGEAVFLLYGTLLMIAAAAMVAAGGELGALTLPVRWSRLFGVIITLLMGAAASRTRSLGALGSVVIPVIFVFFLAAAFQGGGQADTGAQGLALVVPMSAMYAAFNASLSGGVLCALGPATDSPARMGRLVAGLLAVILLTADIAMLRAGPEVRSAALPSVILAAEWGVAGFYFVAAVFFLAVVSTLGAMLLSLRAQISSLGVKRVPALLIAMGGAWLLSVCGFETLTGFVYPALGWISAIALIALTVFLPGRNEQTLSPPSR